MQAPRLYETAAFNASKDYQFTFLWNGNQAMGTKLTVRQNNDNTVVYSADFISMKPVYLLAAESLINGTCYNAYIEILDGSGNIISDRSNVIVFYCYSTPTFSFNNISTNTIIENSMFTVVVDYIQEEGEILSQYQIGLYSSNHTLVKSQGLQYLTSPVNQVSAIISALENNMSYYVRGTGKTQNGIELDTGFVLINVNYIQPAMFAWVDLVNVKSRGEIQITSNMISLRGTSNPPEDELTYIDGTMVDLTQDGTYIEFSEGFEFSENFSMAGLFLGATVNLPILAWNDTRYNAKLYYREGQYLSQNNILKGYFELQVDFPYGISTVTTEYLSPIEASTKYTIWITKIKNIYQLTFNKEV